MIQRQDRGEYAAVPRFALHRNGTALSLHDMAREGQAEPGSLLRLAAVGELRKLLEQAAYLLGGDPYTAVFHFQAERLVAFLGDAE